MVVDKARETYLETHVVGLVLPLAHIFIGDKERHVTGRIREGGIPFCTGNIIPGVSKITPEEHTAHILVDSSTVCVELQGLNLLSNPHRLEVALGVVVSGECVSHLGRCVYHTSGSILRVVKPDALQFCSLDRGIGSCLGYGQETGKQSRNQYGRYLEYLVLHNYHLLGVTICTKSRMEPSRRYGGWQVCR